MVYKLSEITCILWTEDLSFEGIPRDWKILDEGEIERSAPNWTEPECRIRFPCADLMTGMKEAVKIFKDIMANSLEQHFHAGFGIARQLRFLSGQKLQTH